MRGFTLLELIVVIIIVGVLGSLGFVQYTRAVEKARGGEAKDLLGQIRKAEESYRLETSAYTGTITDLYVEVPTSCTTTHYFRYSITASTGTATRCTTSGKSPNFSSTTPYTVTLTYAAGAWSGSAGYY